MDLLARIAQVIVPVSFIVAVGFFYGRRAPPDLTRNARDAVLGGRSP